MNFSYWFYSGLEFVHEKGTELFQNHDKRRKDQFASTTPYNLPPTLSSETLPQASLLLASSYLRALSVQKCFPRTLAPKPLEKCCPQSWVAWASNTFQSQHFHNPSKVQTVCSRITSTKLCQVPSHNTMQWSSEDTKDCELQDEFWLFQVVYQTKIWELLI